MLGKWDFFPRVDKVKLKIIRKTGDRDWTLTNSYRPISLLPMIGKIYERMVATRITIHTWTKTRYLATTTKDSEKGWAR